MKRILLVRTYAPVTHASICPPLGIMYLASSLRERAAGDREIRITDMRIKPMTVDDIRQEIAAFGPDIVGLSTLSYEARTMYAVARAAKELNRECRVVVGGPHGSMFYDHILADPAIDAVVVGEGERPWRSLVQAWAAGEEAHGIEGVALRGREWEGPGGDGGPGRRKIDFRPAPAIEDLDTLPMPAWDLVDIEGYARRPNMNSMLARPRYMAVMTSRACPYHCLYCHALFGRGFRSRSPDHVYEELCRLKNDFGVEEFHIVDDVFNLKKERAHAICDRIIEGGLDVRLAFPNGLRGDLMDRELIDHLVRAGCYSMTYAVETASPRLQKLLRKNMDLERLRKVIDWSHKAGVVTKGFFMLGFPTETLEEIDLTIDYARRSRLLIAGFFTVIPFPRTPLFDLARKVYPELSSDPADCFYYTEEPFYTRATGVDLNRLRRRANRAFFLNPRRLFTLLRRVPRKRYLLKNLYPFLQLSALSSRRR